MEFRVHFEDGSIEWIPYSKDLFDTVPYEDFCRRTPELYTLLFPADRARELIAEVNRCAITELSIGDTAFIDIRTDSHDWFKDEFNIIDKYDKKYVIEYIFTHFKPRSGNRFMMARCPILDATFVCTHHFIKSYVLPNRAFDPNTMVLIDVPFVLKHPFVLHQQKRDRLIKHYSTGGLPA